MGGDGALKLLGVDLSGNLKDKEKQVLSGDRLREARVLLQHVLGAAEAKNQPRVSRHITAAIEQITKALSNR